MTHLDFDVLLERRLKLTADVLGKKAGDYAVGDDRLYNFKRSAQIAGKTPVEMLMAFATKHVCCVYDMADAAAKGAKIDPERIGEKVGDAINYLILLEALLKEGK